ncbi:NAD(P)H-binding protein [Pendulispora rubella]|uniref:NAD(P)H-binding protein n=1 Tax=Pendulispora rubella TaxID=2741070 RepID=A0ABZ2KRV3_9BACT
MNVFLTGATGYVGGAIAKELRAAGVEVLALVRTEEKARAVRERGMVPILGTLEALERHAETAGRADAIVHAAFDDAHEERDAHATRALLAAGSRAFVYASSAYNRSAWRFALEEEVLAAGGDRMATSVVRLGMVYGGLGGTMPDLFAAAEAHGTSFYVGEGRARVSAIHRADAARLFHAIVRQGGRGIFEGVDGEPVTARALAEAVARTVGCRRIESVCAEQAPAEFREHTCDVLERDVAVAQTHGASVGWTPRFPNVPAGLARAYEEWKEEAIRVG